jgi:hypothetical protein
LGGLGCAILERYQSPRALGVSSARPAAATPSS